jgi:hemerythrin
LTYFEWNDTYSVQVREIDNQHKKLVAILNGLFEAMHAGQGRDALEGVLDDLTRYTRTHFAFEERLMAEYGYPEFLAHKQVHAKMADKVRDLSRQFQAGTLFNPVQVSNFLKNWLSRHIMETDKKYAAFFQNQGLR